MNRDSSSATASSAPATPKTMPQDGANIRGNPVLIYGTFPDSGGDARIIPESAHVVVSGRDVTGKATITPGFFSLRSDLPPGTHTVDVSAQDACGRLLHYRWQFTVSGKAASNGTAQNAMPLQILSPADHAQVGAGLLPVRGRTAPNAGIEARAFAVTQVGSYYVLHQAVASQSAKADADGNFAFIFRLQPPEPGTHYEIVLRAAKGELARESRLVLFTKK